MSEQQTVVWEPQAGPQTHLIECPVFEVFFGGARGGGKTEGSIGDWLEHADTYGANANGIFLRRTSKQLEEVVARTRIIFGPLGAHFREQKGEWVFTNGARLKFRYLERDTDAAEYQGHNYTWCGVEEVTNFPSPEPINKMRATLRSSAGVRVRMVLTGNPGGPGHQWVKERYIVPAPKGYKIIKEPFNNPFTKETVELERVYIPSRLSDNSLLMRNDPMYVARLQQQGSAQLVKAWLEGNWDIVLGAFFDCFRLDLHVLPIARLHDIPKEALRFRAFDWGSAAPFSVGWYAVSDGNWGFPKGALIKYREWYGSYVDQSGAHRGLKMDAEQVAVGILERDKDEYIRYSVADPSIFQRDGGPSIGERMMLKKVVFRPADRKRIIGWDQMRKYLQGENNIPMLYFLECCESTIRTIPALQHDERNAEDLDTDGEDHAADETRYACMSRPWVPKQPVLDVGFVPPPDVKTMTMGKLTKEHLEKRRREREEMRI